ncbi:MAG: hypothetical protein VR70_07005 [Rhodospirillaceae bacterium BRH_c57]|nr:MAG: hypothetical protein VR70_07005 [Rhodospirillaceae bacterium BRH_c57]
MSDALRKQVGGRLKELREARGLTQVQLAHLLGKALETISNFERGKTLPSLVTLEQLAGVLGVSMKEFFDDRVIQRSEDDLDAVLAELRALSSQDQVLAAELVRSLARVRQRGR